MDIKEKLDENISTPWYLYISPTEQSRKARISNGLHLYLAVTAKHSQEKILSSWETIHWPQVKAKQATSRRVGQNCC